MLAVETEPKPIEVIGPYKVHPVASLFPAMNEEEYDGLKNSIASHGQQMPIVVLGDQLLDGRHRMKICLELKRTPLIEQYHGRLAPAEYIFEVNYQRRDLTDDNREDVALAALPLILAEAKARQQAGRESGGRGHKKLPVQSAQQVSVEPPDITRKQFAKVAGISERKAQQMITAVKKEPELLEAAKEGVIAPVKAAIKRAAKKPRQFRKWSYAREFAQAQKVVVRTFQRCPEDEMPRLKTDLMKVVRDAAKD